MTDYDRRNGGSRGGYNNRKRRYREDDDFDRRPQRRRHEEPLHLKLRKQLLAVAESPLRKPEEELNSIAKLVVDNHGDEEIRIQFQYLLLQLVVEQPFKIPFVAAIIIAVNAQKPELAGEILLKTGKALDEHMEAGAWREVKLLLRFLACLQNILEGDGVFPVLEELFSRAVDLQTASSEDSLGLELVKIILLTIAYIMASSANAFEEPANALLTKTDIIATAPHPLETLVNPYPGNDNGEVQELQSVISLLQRQLQVEATQAWKLACIPRPWNLAHNEAIEENGTEASTKSEKHALPVINVPSPVNPGLHPKLPEVYFSVYADQDIETVPPISDIASSIIRDSLIDTINTLDYNRNATAKFLIDLDCYFAPDTFVKRATQFDKLRNIDEGRSTWKPEDVAVDAVFSQMLQLPAAEHKLVYYHSVLTEACKLAPAAIAPSLGRAIRWLYKNVGEMDLELVYRFEDWFSHHLSNFGFTWKWMEWEKDVQLPMVHPRKAFMVGALEKEIRLSFAARIRGTLPEDIQPLISEAKEKDTPEFKYNSDEIPYAGSAKELLRLLRTKAADTEIQTQLTTIEDAASSLGVGDTLIPSTDAYMTAICYLGSKSLSHVLSQIERCKERLLSIGQRSEPARRQIITSVMDYWNEKPGVGVNVVDKLLNYTILTPNSVALRALGDQLGKGEGLVHSHAFEMVSNTIAKVTNRVRQVVLARNAPGLPADQVAILDETLMREREEMGKLFATIEDALVGVAGGSVDEMAESAYQDDNYEAVLRGWGARWLRVVRRKMAVEEAWYQESMEQARQRRERGEDQRMDGIDGGEGQDAFKLDEAVAVVQNGNGMGEGNKEELDDIS